MRIAMGGIHIECSTYSPLRTTLDDFDVLRGDDLSAHPSFLFLRDYPHKFLYVPVEVRREVVQKGWGV